MFQFCPIFTTSILTGGVDDIISRGVNEIIEGKIMTI